jgi:hypothetical protein
MTGWLMHVKQLVEWKLTDKPEVLEEKGRAIAQAVSRWLPTAAALVRVQVRSCRICGGQSGTGVGFLRVLRFPLPILIPSTAPHSPSSIIRGWYNRPNCGRRTKRTQSPPPTNSKKTRTSASPPQNHITLPEIEPWTAWDTARPSFSDDFHWVVNPLTICACGQKPEARQLHHTCPVRCSNDEAGTSDCSVFQDDIPDFSYKDQIIL